MKTYPFLIGLIFSLLTVGANAGQITLENLLWIAPFDLMRSPPTSADLGSQFGKARQLERGQSGERYFAQRYGFSPKSGNKKKISFLFVFLNSEASARVSGISLTKSNLNCPSVRHESALEQVTSSPLFNAFLLSASEFQGAMPQGHMYSESYS